MRSHRQCPTLALTRLSINPVLDLFKFPHRSAGARKGVSIYFTGRARWRLNFDFRAFGRSHVLKLVEYQLPGAEVRYMISKKIVTTESPNNEMERRLVLSGTTFSRFQLEWLQTSPALRRYARPLGDDHHACVDHIRKASIGVSRKLRIPAVITTTVPRKTRILFLSEKLLNLL